MNFWWEILVAEIGWREISYIQQDDGNGRKTSEDAMEVTDWYYLDDLKRNLWTYEKEEQKTYVKTVFTRTIRKLMALMGYGLPSRR